MNADKKMKTDKAVNNMQKLGDRIRGLRWLENSLDLFFLRVLCDLRG
jgi:hypothetical protein